MSEVTLERIDEYRWRIPQTGRMRVPGIVYADAQMIKELGNEEALKQVANVAHLPGILKYSLAMPDMHWGYGFPIGGVAALDWEEGVVSPGGVGYDINCGVRLLGSGLSLSEVKPRMEELVDALFDEVPTGVGATGPLKLSVSDERQVMVQGAKWAIAHGYGLPADIDHMEEHGCLAGADPDAVSDKATERGRRQLGTLGSGNHFLEVGYVQEIYDEAVAQAFGLRLDQITLFIHTGSRGFGYQICDDFLKIMEKKGREIELPDRQLACAYIKSPEAQQYLAAMACAANYAWANRQMITHWTRRVLQKIFGVNPSSLRLVYDVCHNIAKREKHRVNGGERWVCVHRKGATRAFPPGHPHVPEAYRHVGQPVLIPGDMGRNSYVLVGTQRAMDETWGTACHGAGRVMSRTQAKKTVQGRSIERDLLKLGVIVKGRGWASLAEEVPQAYKDVSHVVEVVHRAGISRKVAKLRPLGVIKG